MICRETKLKEYISFMFLNWFLRIAVPVWVFWYRYLKYQPLRFLREVFLQNYLISRVDDWHLLWCIISIVCSTAFCHFRIRADIPNYFPSKQKVRNLANFHSWMNLQYKSPYEKFVSLCHHWRKQGVLLD